MISSNSNPNRRAIFVAPTISRACTGRPAWCRRDWEMLITAASVGTTVSGSDLFSGTGRQQPLAENSRHTPAIRKANVGIEFSILI